MIVTKSKTPCTLYGVLLRTALCAMTAAGVSCSDDTESPDATPSDANREDIVLANDATSMEDIGLSEDSSADVSTGDGCPFPNNTAWSKCGLPGQRISFYDVEHDEVVDGCEHLLGTLEYRSTNISTTGGLNNLHAVDGDFLLIQTNGLSSLAGLEQLERVGGLTIQHAHSLPRLRYLEGLRRVVGSLVVTDSNPPKSLEGLENLECVGQLELADIQSLAPLSSLRIIQGDFRVSGIPMEEVREFMARVTIEGTSYVDGEVWSD